MYFFVTDLSVNTSPAYSVAVHRKIAWRLRASTNIASDAVSATTAQLSAPAGKTTSNFTPGLIADDTNPLSVDISASGYTEVEWCMEATSNASNNQYEFRIVAATDGTPTQTQVAKATIGAAAAGIYIAPHVYHTNRIRRGR